MKKTLLLIGILATAFEVNAQSTDELYTVLSKYNAQTGSTTRMGKLNPMDGMVTNVGEATSPNFFSVTGGSLNQTTNRFNLVSTNFMMSFDIFTGNIINELPITSFYEGTTYFANVRYNNSNNKLYGLASTFTENNQLIGMYLAELNSENGNLTQLSQTSIGVGYQLAGTAIDPEEMVYYYSTGSKFMGIDLYNGAVYSNPDIVFSNPNEFNFTNFSYNCADKTVYGLVVENTQVQDPQVSFPFSIYLMRFGKINPTTGEVTNISEVPLPTAAYSVNAGSTIDPITGTYYFSNGSNVYGISLETGLLTSTTAINNEEGSVINMMTNYYNCLGAVATRPDSTLNLPQSNLEANIKLYPNPTSSMLMITSSLAIDALEVIDMHGKTVKSSYNPSNNLDVQDLQAGVYFLKLISGNVVENRKFVKL
ncbi:MAG: T9SS type A sorting domain-containing protein [Flavobacteriales bacterium]|nr:T9SS type A sorting domain-containing protein [Flavobacteriales bacterium]